MVPVEMAGLRRYISEASRVPTAAPQVLLQYRSNRPRWLMEEILTTWLNVHLCVDRPLASESIAAGRTAVLQHGVAT
jgi:hypothetical protein